MHCTSTRSFLLLPLFILISTLPAAAFNIELNFTGGLSGSQQAAFFEAERFWEEKITGYLTDFSQPGLTINAGGAVMDGAGGVVGSGGVSRTERSGGFTLATRASIQFDIDDALTLEDDGLFSDMVLHEMAHAMGFGTLWGANDVYVAGTGQYTGQHALNAYRSEFGQEGAAFVPVELGGGEGTANGHWDEVDQGVEPTFIADTLGRDMRDELMTGWLSDDIFVSNTTLMSFADIGYEVNAVPLPSSLLLLGFGLAALLRIRANPMTPGRKRT